MNEPLGTTETSMEAILASIRRIIAEDQIQPPPGVRLAPLTRPEPAEQRSPRDLPPDPPSIPPPEPAKAEVAPPAPFKPVSVTQPGAPAPAASAPPAAEQTLPSSAPQTAPAPEPAAPSADWRVLGDRATGGEELVLTQMVASDGSVVALGKRQASAAPASLSSSTPRDVLLLTDALPGSMPDVAMPVVPPKNPEPAARPVPPASAPAPAASAPPHPVPKPETLVTPAAVLEKLSHESGQTPASPLAGAIGVASLEDTVRQTLEPKIQEWLNANLLEIVERLVQQEIDKISRRT